MHFRNFLCKAGFFLSRGTSQSNSVTDLHWTRATSVPARPSSLRRFLRLTSYWQRFPPLHGTPTNPACSIITKTFEWQLEMEQVGTSSSAHSLNSPRGCSMSLHLAHAERKGKEKKGRERSIRVREGCWGLWSQSGGRVG